MQICRVTTQVATPSGSVDRQVAWTVVARQAAFRRAPCASRREPACGRLNEARHRPARAGDQLTSPVGYGRYIPTANNEMVKNILAGFGFEKIAEIGFGSGGRVAVKECRRKSS